MKKLYMIAAAALLAAGAQAQTLKVYMGEEEIKLGETTTFNGGEINDFGAVGKDYKFDPELSLMSDQSGACTLVADCTTGQNVMLCFGGTCVSSQSIEKTADLVAGEKMPLQFEFMGYTYTADEAIPEDVTTEFTAEQGATVISFTVIVNPGNSAVTVLQNDKALRAVKGAVEYSLEAPAEFALYALDDTKVAAWNLAGNGTVSTAHLPAGIYAYTLGKNSGKLYLR